ncbi:MAG TPA: type II secretion system protein N [Dyella sp.]|nr:type II secretion system protein N [Dyella sp.]
MKRWRTLLLIVAALLAALGLLVWFMPARWALAMVQPKLGAVQLRQVSGSVWNGLAGDVVLADGTDLGELHWQLSRRALLGHLQLHATLDGPLAHGRGDLARHGDEAIWSDLHLTVTLDALPRPPTTPWGVMRGELALDIAQLRVLKGWPDSVSGVVRWNDAAVQWPDGRAGLGNLTADLTGSHGVLRAELHDDGSSALQLAGQARISPIGWRLDALLSARDHDAALERWLARLGTPDANGAIHLQRGAGVGALSTGAAP